jgi:hypothetical protein
MTRKERVAHSKRICQKITRKISEFSPPGLGHWDKIDALVQEPSGAFLDALDRWVVHDTPETREDLETAAEALLVAWEEAGDLYRLMEGSPGREANHATA